MHHVLIKDNRVAHVWHGPIPIGITDTYPVAPGSAHVGDVWNGSSAVRQASLVTAEEVNAECERRILELFPIARQLNIVDEGSPDELQDMKNRRNGMRACARALASMSPIPANYRDDRFWQGAAFQAPQHPQGYPQQQLGYDPRMQAQQQPWGQPWGNGGTNQPIIMMQAAPAAAPIIINGAQPGTTVIQGPAQIQQPQAPQINFVAPHPIQGMPAPAPQMGLPAPSSHSVVHAIDEDEIVYETAARALAGQESAIQYMTDIAHANGQDWKPYSEALMKARFERFDRVLKAKAGAP